MSRVLITGAAGFIGSHMARGSRDAGHEVHVVVRPGSDDSRLDGLEASIIRHDFDLQSEDAMKRCLSEVTPDMVFHLAAKPRRREEAELADVKAGTSEHLSALLNLLGAASSVARPPQKIIRTGSIAEYGIAATPYDEDVREMPVTAYGAELAAATHLVGGLQRRLPFPVITARLALVYGPTQSTEFMVPLFIERCLAGQPCIVHQPDDRRDLLHVGDVVDALLRIADAPISTRIVNIASGIAPTMREVAALIVERTGADPNLIELREGRPSTGRRELRASVARAKDLFGWSARISLPQGISRTVEWQRQAVAPPSASSAATAKDGLKVVASQ